MADCETMDAARAQIARHGFDLVVLDTTVEDVRWLAAQGKDAAIVFLDHKGANVDLSAVVAAGATDCFSKAEYDDNPAMLWLALRQSIRYHAILQQRRHLADALRERDIQLVQLTQKLWRVSPYDFRTGWFNQSQILERLNEELRRARRYKLPFTIALIEFLDMRALDEQLGVGAAGMILAQVAQRTRSVTRLTDVIGHYGVDACLFLLTNTNLNGGVRFCERVSKALRDAIHYQGQDIRLRWCFGVVENELGRFDDAMQILAIANDRLEQAKALPDIGAVVAD